MELDVVSIPPRVEDFTPLVLHQDQTPSSFFGGRPVLHLHSPDAKLRISKQELESEAKLARLALDGESNRPNGTASSADSTGEEQVTIENIDVWVTSSYAFTSPDSGNPVSHFC